MKTVFVADLHLKPGTQPRQNARLRVFLTAIIAARATRLLLLGDTFNFWCERGGKVVGDYAEIFSLFRAAANSGITIDLLSGNRDFLIGSSVRDAAHYRGFFRGRAAANALSQLTVQAHINPRGFNCRFGQDGEIIHCTHGDMYALRDPGHGMMRWWTMSLTARLGFAYAPFLVLRGLFAPLQHRATLPGRRWLPTTALIPPEVLSPLADEGVAHIFCGHFHYPYSTEKIVGEKNTATLHLLPAWFVRGEYAVLENRQVQIHSIKAENSGGNGAVMVSDCCVKG